MQYPSSACLLRAWELTAAERSVCRPLSWLSAAFGWARQDLERLSLGERNRLILQARCLLFGTSMSGLTSCRACGEQMEFEISTYALLEAPPVASAHLAVKGDGFEIEVRPITGGDVEAISGFSNCREALFRRCLAAGSWQDADLDRVIQAAGECLSGADPLAEVSIDLVCPVCAATFSPRFDPWRFFWEELEVWARRVLRQVHHLASAYGWTEDQVLALSPSRRAIYLEMVGG